MNRKNVIAAVWLIGLGILFMIGYIWPGILILIGITMIVNATKREEQTVTPPTTTLRQAQSQIVLRTGNGCFADNRACRRSAG